MPGLVDAARLLWCHGLAQIQGKPSQSVQAWLSSATFAPSLVGKALVLGGIDNAELLKAIGCDINRLSSAASETLRNVVEIPSVPKSLGWPYVKLYYSAMFYAHAMLRVWGKSPSYLKTTDLLHLWYTLDVYGLASPFTLNTGQFFLVADTVNSQAILTTDKGGGGTHEAIWREFVKTLNELKTAVSNSQFLSADKKDLNLLIDRAIDIMTNGGANSAWLSFMRNEINYRQAAGVWYPYKGRAKTSELSTAITKMLSTSSDGASFLAATGDDLVLFRSACLFLIAFSRHALADLSAIGGPKAFLKYGQTQFEIAYP